MADVEMVPLPKFITTGSAVSVRGIGPGFVQRVTRRRKTPYDVYVPSRSATYNCAESHLDMLTGDDATAMKDAYTESLLEASRAFNELVLGSTVSLTRKGELDPNTYVIIGAVRDGKCKIAKLGGDGNRYITCNIEAISLKEI